MLVPKFESSARTLTDSDFRIGGVAVSGEGCSSDGGIRDRAIFAEIRDFACSIKRFITKIKKIASDFESDCLNFSVTTSVTDAKRTS